MTEKVFFIKQNVTVPQLLEFYGYKPSRRIPCPIHGGDGNNFEVFKDSYCCYSRCGSGDVISLAMALSGLSFADAVKQIDTDFDLGLFKKPSLGQHRKAQREIAEREKQRLAEEKARKQAEDNYWTAYDEYLRLETNKLIYAPKTADEPRHPLFTEALNNLSAQRYIVDLMDERRDEFDRKKHIGNGHR